MDKLELIKNTSFGSRIAEEEKDQLRKYFVETNAFERIISGQIDIIYGPKGSGKSAIYSILSDSIDELFEKNILFISAEKPRGTPVFSNLSTDPPASEQEFIMLWKLYLVQLTANQFIEYDFRDTDSIRVLSILREDGLIPEERNIKNYILYGWDYVKRWFRPKDIAPTIEFDSITGNISSASLKITPNESSSSQLKAGLISVDTLLELVNRAITSNNISLWIAIDRLDVAFNDNIELENRALRALFKVYLDMIALSNIRLKIFLRDDIWNRITEEGFREASHITRVIYISWSQKTILNLIMKRLLANEDIEKYYEVNKEEVLSDLDAQEELFYKIFPEKVEIGERQSKTLDWIETRVKDGKDEITPREVIHLLNSAQEIQVQQIEIGSDLPSDDNLIDRFSIKEAIYPVSTTKLQQTIFAEYPELKKYIQALEKQRTEQSLENLTDLWNISIEEGNKVLRKLINLGILKTIETNKGERYKVPFLYRPGLNMIQGSVDNA